MGVIHFLKESNANIKAGYVLPYINKRQSILDFGCGDVSLSKALLHRDSTLSLVGLDVVDFGVKDKKIHVQKYDGKKIPYKDKQFDVVISYHVLHHTADPFGLLSECLRVCHTTLLLVEPVYRFRGEIFGMSFMDWIFNIWKDRTIAMTYAYKTKKQWIHAIEGQGWKAVKIVDVELMPKWFPTGRSYLFVCTKNI